MANPAVRNSGTPNQQNSNAASSTDPNSESKDGSPVPKVVKRFTTPIKGGDRFIYESGIFVDENSKDKFKIAITRNDAAKERLEVEVEVAYYTTDDMRQKAVEIGTFTNKGKMYLSVDYYNNSVYILLFHGQQADCIEDTRNENLVLGYTQQVLLSSKYILIAENKQDPVSSSIFYPYFGEIYDNDKYQ